MNRNRKVTFIRPRGLGAPHPRGLLFQGGDGSLGAFRPKSHKPICQASNRLCRHQPFPNPFHSSAPIILLTLHYPLPKTTTLPFAAFLRHGPTHCFNRLCTSFRSLYFDACPQHAVRITQVFHFPSGFSAEVTRHCGTVRLVSLIITHTSLSLPPTASDIPYPSTHALFIHSPADLTRTMSCINTAHL